MAHECDDCGETFETLSRLRLHDCGTDQSETSPTNSTGGAFTATDIPESDDPDVSIENLDECLVRVSDGETAAIHRAVAEFESALAAALDGGSEAYRDVFWPYYERVADALDGVTRAEGWELLGEVVTAYDPTAEESLPLATAPIANAVGRFLVRTRRTADVEAIPVAALEYLDAVAVNAADQDDIELEETHAYGWGIGHPDHSVVDRLRDRALMADLSVNPSLEHAFYADQHAAVAALERLVRDESIDGQLSYPRRDDLPYRRYLLDCVYGLQTDDHRPRTPRYYDWSDEPAYAFELGDSVERRIRDLVAETGFDTDLPDEWSLRDLGL